MVSADVARGERRRPTGIAMRPAALESPDRQWQSLATLYPVMSNKAAAPPSPREAAALGAKLQKVMEMTLKGVEVWFVLGAAEGGDPTAQFTAEAEPRGPLTAAGIASLKKKSRVSPTWHFIILNHARWMAISLPTQAKAVLHRRCSIFLNAVLPKFILPLL